MSEELQSIWKKRWNGPRALFLWFLILAGAIFVLVFAFGYLSEPDSSVAFASITSATAIVLFVVFLHWLRRWRNLKRVLFGVACLVTLIALFYAEENWRGKRAWENYKREWEAKGEKFDILSLAPKSVPDDQNFAMTPLLKPIYEYDRGTKGLRWRDTNAYNHLQNISAYAYLSHPQNEKNKLDLGSVERGTFADLEACRNFYRGNTNYPQPVKSGTAAEDILMALSKFDAEMKELGEAATMRPDTRFPIEYDYEMPANILLPHLSMIKGLSMLLQLRVVARLEAGQTEEAFTDLKLRFRLSDALRDEPILIDHLVRIATLAMNFQSVREGLLRHSWNDDQLAELEKHLASVDLLAELNQAIRGERALSVGSLDWMRRQGFSFRSTELSGGYDGEGSPLSFGVPNFMPSGWFYQNMLTIARLHQNYTLAMIDEKAHRFLPDIREAEVSAVTKMPARPYTIFAKLLFPALAKASMKSARMQTYVDAAIIACALERYRLVNGQFPDTLDALVPRFVDKIPNDVIDGKPLRYRITPDGGYLIYSVGWNKTDDGGVAPPPKGASVDWEKKRDPVDPEKGDWVWRYPAKE